MLGCFKSERIDFDAFDFSKVDISKIDKKHFQNKDIEDLLVASNFDDAKKALLKKNISYTYSINLPEGVFYFIDDIGNGDVLAIDTLGNSYLLIHDP